MINPLSIGYYYVMANIVCGGLDEIGLVISRSVKWVTIPYFSLNVSEYAINSFSTRLS